MEARIRVLTGYHRSFAASSARHETNEKEITNA
jgi:hypothetical protein